MLKWLLHFYENGLSLTRERILNSNALQANEDRWETFVRRQVGWSPYFTGLNLTIKITLSTSKYEVLHSKGKNDGLKKF